MWAFLIHAALWIGVFIFVTFCAEESGRGLPPSATQPLVPSFSHFHGACQEEEGVMFLSLMTARQGWKHLPLPASATLSPRPLGG